jgi:ribonuclease-3
MPPTNTNTYEPLEFLGDAYLEVIATRIIHDRFPNHTVGQKSGLREILIRNDTLFQYSRDYGFGQRVKLTGVEPNGKMWLKVLADVFEAYVACVILSDSDHGFQTAETWLAQLWEPRISEWRTQGDGKVTAVDQVVNLDVKSDLQRLLVSKGVKLDYLEEKPMQLMREGNKTTFYMGVYLTGWGHTKQRLGGGMGRSKQIASAEAAKDAFVTGRGLVEEAHRAKVAYDKVHSTKRLK